MFYGRSTAQDAFFSSLFSRADGYVESASALAAEGFFFRLNPSLRA
jgi:hypothetical protein